MCTDDISYCYCKVFVVFCNVNLYILCIYDLFHSLLSLLHSYGSMECTHGPVCVCVCVCVCERESVCVCVSDCTYVNM